MATWTARIPCADSTLAATQRLRDGSGSGAMAAAAAAAVAKTAVARLGSQMWSMPPACMRVPGSGVMCAVTSKHCSVQQPVQTSPAVVFACMCCCPRRRRRPFDLDGNARRRYLTHSFHCTSLPSCARQQGRRLALAPAVPPVVGTAHPKPAVLRRSGRGKGTICVMRGVCKRWALALLAVAACAASAHAQQGNAVSVLVSGDHRSTPRGAVPGARPTAASAVPMAVRRRGQVHVRRLHS